ncbi:MAG: PKD domain-containing protein [Cyclobacteriaceae bacterium]
MLKWCALIFLGVLVLSCGTEDSLIDPNFLEDNFSIEFERFDDYTLRTYRYKIESDPEVTYLWNFGDGQTSSECCGVHTYDDYGEYLVAVTITKGEQTITKSLRESEKVMKTNLDIIAGFKSEPEGRLFHRIFLSIREPDGPQALSECHIDDIYVFKRNGAYDSYANQFNNLICMDVDGNDVVDNFGLGYGLDLITNEFGYTRDRFSWWHNITEIDDQTFTIVGNEGNGRGGAESITNRKEVFVSVYNCDSSNTEALNMLEFSEGDDCGSRGKFIMIRNSSTSDIIASVRLSFGSTSESFILELGSLSSVNLGCNRGGNEIVEATVSCADFYDPIF